MAIHAVHNSGRQVSSRMLPIERDGIKQVLPDVVVLVQKPIVDTYQTAALKCSPTIKCQGKCTRFPHFQTHETNDSSMQKTQNGFGNEMPIRRAVHGLAVLLTNALVVRSTR